MEQAPTNQSSLAEPHFDADRPIEHRKDDRLGRKAFAESVAKRIQDVPAEHGFTIAVTGEWGSGKTSILNMVAEVLEDETIAVLRFNPWLFGGTNELVTRFFQELSAQLGQVSSEKLKEVAKLLSTLGEGLAPLSPVPGTTIVAKLLFQTVDRWAKPRSLHLEREHLKEVLATSGAKVVVLIDDIDRLEPAEIREVVRLVRLTSDLPNVIFLLAYDRRHVAKSLGTSESEGLRYLEKIVQVSYQLPLVRESILPEMFLPWLAECVSGRDVVELDPEVWTQVFYDVIKPLFTNLRDVKRYLYSLPITFDMVGREVALADLLSLDAIRVLRPELFEALRTHSDCLVHSSSDIQIMMGGDSRKQEIKKTLLQMLDHAAADREILESVFRHLFPVTQEILGTFGYSSDSKAAWRRDRRVACEEMLRIYLQAGLDDTVVSSGEIQALLDALTDETQLETLLGGLDADRLGQALEWLEDYQGEYPIEAVPTAVPVLTNLMGNLSAEPGGFLAIPPRIKVSRVILRLMRRMDDPETLATCIGEILQKVPTLSGRLDLVEMVSHRESVGHRLVSEVQARKLEQQIVKELESITTDHLRAEWDLIGLSLRPLLWLQDAEKRNLAERLRSHLSNDEFVLALLRSAVVNIYSTGGLTGKGFHWDDLVTVFGEEIAAAAARLSNSPLWLEITEDDRDTVNLANKYAAGEMANECYGIA